MEASIETAPKCLNLNDKAMWVLGWNECLAAGAQEQRKPLSDEEIDKIWRQTLCDHQQEICRVTRTGKWFARDIEAAHGIKEQP